MGRAVTGTAAGVEIALMMGVGVCLVEQLSEGLYLPGAISGPDPIEPVLMLALWAWSRVTDLKAALALSGRARVRAAAAVAGSSFEFVVAFGAAFVDVDEGVSLLALTCVGGVKLGRLFGVMRVLYERGAGESWSGLVHKTEPLPFGMSAESTVAFCSLLRFL